MELDISIKKDYQSLKSINTEFLIMKKSGKKGNTGKKMGMGMKSKKGNPRTKQVGDRYK